MPRRRSVFLRPDVPKLGREGFDRRFDALEARRTELTARLATLSQGVMQHSRYKTVRSLLNETFRKETLTRRAAVLRAASWLMDVLE
jgi:hypothetical protein